MKPRSLVNLSFALLIAAAVNAIVGTAGAASAPASAAATLNGPTISSIRLEGTNVAVTAQIPAGVNVVTLEGRTRVGAGGWIPRAVLHLLRIRLRDNAKRKQIRNHSRGPGPGSADRHQ